MYQPLILWYYICSLIYASAQEIASVSVPGFNVSLIQESTPKTFRRKWISELFHEAEATFDIDAEVSEECRRDFLMYKLYADNQTVWAVRMMESTEWPRVGVFAGMTTFIGNWEECLRSRGPSRIQGQYCQAEASYSFETEAVNQESPDWVKYPEENASAWSVIEMYDTMLIRLSRRKVTWALCIPSSCSAADLQKSLISTLLPIFKKYELNIAVNVNPMNCEIQKTTNVTYSRGFYFTVTLFTFLVLLVISATTYHILKDRSEAQEEYFQEAPQFVTFLKCFSVLSSWKALTNVSSSTYVQLYAIRFICMILIVVGHEAVFSMGTTKLQQEDTEMMYKPWNLGFGLPALVDIFFMISGFLTFHFGFAQVKKGGIVSLIVSLIARWLRLIPALVMVLLFFMFVGPYLGDGPFWNSRLMNEVNYCYSTWWTQLIALSNVVNIDHICLIHTWYVSADIQLAILGSAFLFILSKYKKTGIVLMVLTLLSGSVATFITIYGNNYSGMPIPVVVDLETIRRIPSFLYLHLQTYPKLGSYITGCVLSLLIDSLKRRKYRITWWQKYALLGLAMAVGYGFQLYSFLFLMIGRPYNPLENALFGSIHRLFFVMPICCYIGLNFLTGDVPVIDQFLSLKIFLPLGRLSYGLYLIHYPFLVYLVSISRRVEASASILDIALRWMIDLGYSLLMAFFLYLLSEGPINNLLHMLNMNATRRIKEKPKERSISFSTTAPTPVQ